VQEFVAALDKQSRDWVSTADAPLQAKLPELKSSDQPLVRQVLLAKSLPDYWQRFEQATQAFAKARLGKSPPRRSFWGRLLNMKGEE